MGYVIGLDVGDVRIGIARSDYSRLIASPLEVLTRVGWGPDSRAIAALCAEHDTHEVVCGLPRNMDGSEGFQAKKVREFAAQLEKCGLTVYYQDERLTTVTAEDALRAGGVFRQERRQVVDKVAAAVILQTWLDAQRIQAEASAAQAHQTYRRKKAMSEELFEEENNDGIVELIDDEGNVIPFEHLATIEYEGNLYVCLTEADSDEEEAEVTILRIDTDENDEDYYSALEDEELEEKIFQRFLEMVADQEETDEDED